MKRVFYFLLLTIPVFLCFSCLETIIGPIFTQTEEFIYMADQDIYRYNLQTLSLDKLTQDGEWKNYADPIYMKGVNRIGYRSANSGTFLSMTLSGLNQFVLFDLTEGGIGLDYCSETYKIFMYTGSPRKLAMVDDNGDNFTYLTSPENYDDARPSVNARGDKVLFQSNRTGIYQIYLMDLNTNATIQLTFEGTSKAFPKWSNSELGFYYEEMTSDNIHGILMYYDFSSHSTSEIARFTDFIPFYFNLSPDDDKVALTFSPLGGSRNLYIYDIERQTLEQKTNLSKTFEGLQWYRFNTKIVKNMLTAK